MSPQKGRKPLTKFERMQQQQKYGATKQKYEQSAYGVAVFLTAAWTILWLALGLVIPRAAMWMFIIWIVGSGALGGAMLKVQSTKKASAKYLNVAKPLQELYAMNALDFEHAVATRMHFWKFENVRVTQAMGDGGVDILMEKNGLRYAVQCKKWRPESFIGIDTLRAFVYAYRKAGCDRGIFVTTAQFSDFARREMAEEGVLLVDGARLITMDPLE